VTATIDTNLSCATAQTASAAICRITSENLDLAAVFRLRVTILEPCIAGAGTEKAKLGAVAYNATSSAIFQVSSELDSTAEAAIAACEPRVTGTKSNLAAGIAPAGKPAVSAVFCIDRKVDTETTTAGLLI
jgi:hypothetical protein